MLSGTTRDGGMLLLTVPLWRGWFYNSLVVCIIQVLATYSEPDVFPTAYGTSQKLF